MQQCGDCLKVYDESENIECPYCEDEDSDEEELESMIPCPECEGTGKEECFVCEGEGSDPDDDERNCPECNGEGTIECAECEDDTIIFYLNNETGEIRKVG